MPHDSDSEPLDTRCRELVDRLEQPLRRDLEERENVHGTAIGLRKRDGEWCDEVVLVVYVSEKVAEQDLAYEARIPGVVELDGETVPTDVRAIGTPSVDAGSPTRDEEIRPVLGGTAVGRGSGMGTVSALFRTRDGERRVLTSRHIISRGSQSDALERGVSQPPGGGEIGEVVATHDYSTAGTRRNILDTVLVEPAEDVTIASEYIGWDDADTTGRSYIGDRLVTFSAGGGIAGGSVVARGADITLELQNGDTARYGQLVEYDWNGAAGSSGAMVGQLDPRARTLTIVGQHAGSGTGASWLIPWVHIERQFGILLPEGGRSPGRVGEREEPGGGGGEGGDGGDGGGGGGGGDGGTGNVTIVVEDPAGNPLEGASVTVESTESATSEATIVVEDSSGNPLEGARVTVDEQ